MSAWAEGRSEFGGAGLQSRPVNVAENDQKSEPDEFSGSFGFGRVTPLRGAPPNLGAPLCVSVSLCLICLRALSPALCRSRHVSN